jgi:hypothetical protein
MFSRILWILALIAISSSSVFAANTIRRGNLIIDLDTGKITIANDNAEYTSLLETGSTTTWSTIIQTGTINTGSTITNNNSGGTNTTTTTGSEEVNNTINSNLSEIEQAIAWMIQQQAHHIWYV